MKKNIQTIILFSMFCLSSGIIQSQSEIFDVLSRLSINSLDSLITLKEVDDDIKKHYLNAYIDKATKLNDTLKIAKGYYKRAYISLSDPVSGIRDCDSIIKFTKNIVDDTYPALGYMMRGYFNYLLGNNKIALEDYLIGNKYAVTRNNIDQQLEVLDFVGGIKDSWGAHDEALEIHKKINKIILEDVDYRKSKRIEYLYSLHNLTNSYLRNRKIDSARLYADKGLKESIRFNNTESINQFILNGGIVSYYEGKYKITIDSINKTKEYWEGTRLALCHYYIGKSKIKLGKLNEGINNLIKVDSIYQITKEVFPELREVELIIKDFYKTLDNPTKQLIYLNKALVIDSILIENSYDINKLIYRDFETPRLMLEKEKIEKDFRESKTIGIVLLFLLMLILIVVSFFLHRNYTNKKRYKNNYDKLIIYLEEREIDDKKNESFEKEQLLPNDKQLAILNSLQLFENNKDFTKNGITLNSLAKKIQTNSSYLSKTINQLKKRNFNTYLNDLRIDFILIELKKNKKLRSYSIKSIAKEIGYNNSESFSKAFKERTGIYPSYYIKNLNYNDIH